MHPGTQGEQLGELVGSCSGGLRDLHVDLCLPAAPGMMPGGGGGAAAAAVLLSLMYAARDVKAVKLEVRARVRRLGQQGLETRNVGTVRLTSLAQDTVC